MQNPTQSSLLETFSRQLFTGIAICVCTLSSGLAIAGPIASITRHEAGGAFVNNVAGDPAQTGSVAFGPVGSDYFYLDASDPFPSAGGVFSTAILSEFQTADTNDANASSFLQYVLTVENDAGADVSGSASGQSIIEFVVPNLSGSQYLELTTSLFLSASGRLEGDTATIHSASGSIENITQATTLLAFDENSLGGFNLIPNIEANSGDIIRLYLSASVSGSFLFNNGPFGVGQAIVLLDSEVRLLGDPETVPGPASLMLLVIGLSGISAFSRLQKRAKP